MTPPTGQHARIRRPGTATRLAAFLAVLLAIVLGLTTFETERIFTSHSMATVTNDLTAQVRQYAATMRATRPTDLATGSVRYLSAQVLPRGEYLLVGLSGPVHLGSSGSGPLLADPALRALLDHPPATTTTSQFTAGHAPLLVVVSPIRSGPSTLGTLVAVANLTAIRADQHRVILVLAGEAAVALLAAVVAAYLLLRRLLRTVGRITAAAGAAAQGDLDRRLGDQGTDDEVGQLAATFDGMLDRLSTAIEAQRRLLSDVSHQMRTPLTVARGHLEVLERVGMDDPDEVRSTVHTVIDELDHMRNLVERLLMLGRVLEPDFLETHPVDLRALVADTFQAGVVLASRQWSRSDVPDVVVDVDADKLRGALLNLLDNAVNATGPDDVIAVSAALEAGRGLVISVDDSGPGLTPDQVTVALTRFGRPERTATGGSGLGLAIVSAVARAHGGEFALGISPLGGCRATIRIPADRVRTSVPVELVGL